MGELQHKGVLRITFFILKLVGRIFLLLGQIPRVQEIPGLTFGGMWQLFPHFVSLDFWRDVAAFPPLCVTWFQPYWNTGRHVSFQLMIFIKSSKSLVLVRGCLPLLRDFLWSSTSLIFVRKRVHTCVFVAFILRVSQCEALFNVTVKPHQHEETDDEDKNQCHGTSKLPIRST